jgi:NlpC/P60 family protein
VPGRLSALGLLLLTLAAACGGEPTYRYVRAASPARTTVVDPGDGRWLATFTDGARTVTLAAAPRTFSEGSASVTVSVAVRLLPAPFAGTVDEAWLAAALADDSPDALAVAMDFVTGAPDDASYGPLVDGVREEGADFQDFMGISWTYPNGTTLAADPAGLRSLDCSGYVRMVFGYRMGIELGLAPGGDALPRRSFEMYQAAPGVVLLPDAGAAPTDMDVLAAGDVLFWDADDGDGTRLDHVGIYLGRDAAGHRRFVSSRRTADGPTMGDTGGASILDGATNLYSRTFRAARRL